MTIYTDEVSSGASVFSSDPGLDGAAEITRAAAAPASQSQQLTTIPTGSATVTIDHPVGLDYRPPEARAYHAASDIPANALDAKDFSSIDAWMDACIAKGVPGKIGSGEYVVDGLPRYAPMGIYGYGDTPPKFVAEHVNAWLYLKDTDVTIKGVAFEGFGQVLAGAVDLTDGAPYHSTTTYAFNRFDPDKGALELQLPASTSTVGPAVTITDSQFINCENAFMFVSDTTQMGAVNFHGNTLTGTYGIVDIFAPLWTEVNATYNEWSDATGDRAQPNLKSNGIQTGFMIGTDKTIYMDGHSTKLNITNNYAHDIDSVGRYMDTNAAVFADVRGVISAERGDNIVSFNRIENLRGLYGQEDSNAIYAKAHGLIIEGNYIENSGAAYYNDQFNGSEATGILVKPPSDGLIHDWARDIEVIGNTFVNMPTAPAGSINDLAVVKISEAIGDSVVSFNTFIGGGNLSIHPNMGVIRIYGDVENMDVVGNHFVDVDIAPGGNAIDFHSIEGAKNGVIEVSNNTAEKTDGDYGGDVRLINFTNKPPGQLLTGLNTLDGGGKMLSSRVGTVTNEVQTYDPPTITVQQDNQTPQPLRLADLQTFSSDGHQSETLVLSSDPRFSVHDGGLYLNAGETIDFSKEPTVEVVLVARDGAGWAGVVLNLTHSGMVGVALGIEVTQVAQVAENAEIEIRVASLHLSGGVEGAIYTVNDERFSVHDGGLYLKAGAGLDYEQASQMSVDVTAHLGVASFSKAVQLTVADINDAVTGISASNVRSLAENTAVETKVASLVVTDPDKNEAFRQFTYTVDDPRFYVKGSDLYLKAGQTLDYETASTLRVGVTVSDGAGSAKTTVEIKVTDVDESTKPPAGGVTGTAQADSLKGTDGSDRLAGLAGNDRLEGGAGDDVLNGGLGSDALIGGAGRDAATYENAASAVKVDLLKPAGNAGEAAGDTYSSIEDVVGSRFGDRLSGSNGANILSGGDSDDSLLGFGGADTLLGGAGNDVIQGHGGNDVINGGAGADTLSGGLGGWDRFSFSSGWGKDVITDYEDNLDKIDLSETGLAFKDLTIQQVGANTVISAASGDSITLANTKASLITATDFSFGTGSTTTPVTPPATPPVTSPPNDQTPIDDHSAGVTPSQVSTTGGAGDDILIGTSGADRFTGGAGRDTVDYTNANGAIRADLLKPVANAGEAKGDTYVGVESLTGSRFGDRLSGDNASNVLNGGDGDDNLLGYGGADTLLGGAGDDVIQGHGGNDIINGGAGDDRLSGGLGGWDRFVFSSHWGKDTIVDYEHGVDRLDLKETGLQFADLHIAQIGADTVVSTAAGDSITFEHLQASVLTASDFIF